MGKIIKVLARSKSVEILLGLRGRKLKFSEVVRITGNATTAMRRTQDLHATGLISRRVLQDRQRSVEYTLTKKGEKLIPLVIEMLRIEARR